MTVAAAMKIGAALPDVERTRSWGAPTLKVRGKMMADALRDLLRMGWEFARSRAKRKSSRPVSRARGNG